MICGKRFDRALLLPRGQIHLLACLLASFLACVGSLFSLTASCCLSPSFTFSSSRPSDENCELSQTLPPEGCARVAGELLFRLSFLTTFLTTL